MATLSLSSVVKGTVQIVEGFVVDVTVRVNVGGCEENTVSVTISVFNDLDDNFSLIEYNNYIADTRCRVRTTSPRAKKKAAEL